MADIKTNFRELSVAVGVAAKLEDYPLEKMQSWSGADFLAYAQKHLNHDISFAGNVGTISAMRGEYREMLRDGLKLGRAIVQKRNITSLNSLIWCGGDTQKDDPADLVVNGEGFSLKEHSFILENMGLYKFLTLMTGKAFPRGLHVFRDFARREYEDWFAYTWKAACAQADGWTLRKTNYTSKIKIQGDYLVLDYNGEQKRKVPLDSDEESFQEWTTGKTREKVFAKWIKEELSDDGGYLRRKRRCAEAAGEALCRLVEENYDSRGLGRLLQIREKEYFYAKSTPRETTLLRVPGAEEFAQEIVVEDVVAHVPDSQLNILTTLRNMATDKTIVLRNECRFSHGQFNGTPEAKLYSKGDLSVIYERL